jgi:hypothetical protein
MKSFPSEAKITACPLHAAAYLVICANVEPFLGLLFTFGGKALQQGIELLQVVLKEASNFLGYAQHLPKVNKSPQWCRTFTLFPTNAFQLLHDAM